MLWGISKPVTGFLWVKNRVNKSLSTMWPAIYTSRWKSPIKLQAEGGPGAISAIPFFIS
jgi:hypothetical protein